MEQKLTQKDIRKMFGAMAYDILSTKLTSYDNMVQAEYGRYIATHPEHLKGSFSISYKHERGQSSVSFTKIDSSVVFYDKDFATRCYFALRQFQETYQKYKDFLTEDQRNQLKLYFVSRGETLFTSGRYAREINEKQATLLTKNLDITYNSNSIAKSTPDEV